MIEYKARSKYVWTDLPVCSPEEDKGHLTPAGSSCKPAFPKNVRVPTQHHHKGMWGYRGWNESDSYFLYGKEGQPIPAYAAIQRQPYADDEFLKMAIAKKLFTP